MTTKTFPRKVLYSPGYGAGWSSWANDEAAQFVAEYEPIIDYLENDANSRETEEFKSLIKKLEREVEEKFNCSFYSGGCYKLVVGIVNGPYRIVEYDGSEDIMEQEDGELWFY